MRRPQPRPCRKRGSRRRTIRCAAISSPIATGWRRCPTTPAIRPASPGVEVDKINVAAATPACNEAMQRYPDVTRFVFEAGRVANARKDYAEARRLYDQAAAAGYAMAMNNIGGIYEGGDGDARELCRGGALVPERRSTPASRSRWSISAGYTKPGTA